MFLILEGGDCKMVDLMENIKQSNITSLFTSGDLYKFGYKEPYVSERLQKAVMDCEIINIKKDIYTLGTMLRKELVDNRVLAQMLVPLSYVSMEHVLSEVSWIPESVYVVTSVTQGENKYIETEYGRYDYINIPSKKFYAGVRHITEGVYEYNQAVPLKALADIIFERKYNWTTLKPLYESLRIEDDDLENLTGSDFDELHETYGISNVENFLYGIRKELGL
jgi:hypothetical protein